VYSDPKKIEALIELESHAGWKLQANFQLAHRFAQPPQRWWPRRLLSGPVYVNQWIDDFRQGWAGGRTLEEVADPRFFDWLVERSYAHGSERGSLQDWLSNKPRRIQVHIRPGIQVLRTWPCADQFEPDRKGEFVDEVREAMNRVLSALDEPKLSALRTHTAVEERLSHETRQNSQAVAPVAAATQKTACSTCHMVHAGECL
jgi:hypothetical protein